MTYDKKVKLINAILMAGFMALLMSGCLSLINLGFTKKWLWGWGRSFLFAWPLAFVLSLTLGKAVMAVSHKLAGVREADERQS